MLRHKYKIGDLVIVAMPAIALGGRYPRCVVLRQLPPEGQQLQYHVKSADDGHERVVVEGHLRPYIDNREEAPSQFTLQSDDQPTGSNDTTNSAEEEPRKIARPRSTGPQKRRTTRIMNSAAE